MQPHEVLQLLSWRALRSSVPSVRRRRQCWQPSWKGRVAPRCSQHRVGAALVSRPPLPSTAALARQRRPPPQLLPLACLLPAPPQGTRPREALWPSHPTCGPAMLSSPSSEACPQPPLALPWPDVPLWPPASPWRASPSPHRRWHCWSRWRPPRSSLAALPVSSTPQRHARSEPRPRSPSSAPATAARCRRAAQRTTAHRLAQVGEPSLRLPCPQRLPPPSYPSHA